MQNLIKAQITQLLTHVFVGALFGLLVGQPHWFGLFGLLIWVGRQMYWTAKTTLWARDEIDLPPPDVPGPFGEIAYKFRRYQVAQKRRQESLQLAINRFQQSAAALSDAIVIIDSNDEIEWWNRAGRELLGLIGSDRGQSVLNLFRSPEFVKYYRSTKNSKPVRLKTRTDTRVIEYQLHNFGDGDRVLVARDVSELDMLEQARRDFVANASHELRTPLTVIRGYLEMLEEQEFNPGVAKAIDSMQKQSSRMENLVADLLVLSRLESEQITGDKSRVQVKPMLLQIAEEAQALSADNNHNISVECDPKIDLIGSPKELHSAFSNLIFNAVRYTPAGGDISIELKPMGKGAQFSVTDTGDGIEAEHIPRLTERFYRVDEGRSSEGGGTGLGLAIVKHVLARHNATLGVSSRLGEGSRFSCLFPSERVKVSKRERD